MRPGAAKRPSPKRYEHLLHGRTAPRVVLAHCNGWFAGRVAELLEDAGAQVVASLDNGADAIGLAVAEQPDLMLVRTPWRWPRARR